MDEQGGNRSSVALRNGMKVPRNSACVRHAGGRDVTMGSEIRLERFQTQYRFNPNENSRITIDEDTSQMDTPGFIYEQKQSIQSRLKLLIAVLWVSFLIQPRAIAEEKTAESFSVVLLPDTQFYSEKFPDIYKVQTEWIKANVKKRNIKFVIHLGDIVQNATIREFIVADKAQAVLDGVVPYSMVPGNHDMKTLNKRLTRDTTNYNKYFPPSRYKNQNWYGGHKGETNDNNYCFFEEGELKFMVVSLEFAPTDETIGWARNIISEHKDRRVIVATHCYMRPTMRESTSPRSYGIEGNSGEELFQKLIRKHKNINMVMCGHVLGVGLLKSKNDFDNEVIEMLTDYQGLPKGGNGWLRILKFVPHENKIYVETYSPLLKKINPNEKHTYQLDYPMQVQNKVVK